MIYGIDLGTTNSCVAGWDEKRDQVKFYRNVVTGSTVTPSVVYFDPDDPSVTSVGDDAVSLFKMRPDRTVRGIKRRIGDKDAYDVHTNGLPEGTDPVLVSSLILKKLVEDVKRGYEEVVKDVVITVPAYFGSLERENTKRAAKEIGLNVLELINEPTAAALSYGIDLTEDKNIVVYDLGGGTFDVSFVRVIANVGNVNTFRYIAIDGDAKLGGLDWDREIAQMLLERYNEELGASYSLKKEEELNNDGVEARLTAVLFESAEKIKKLLSSGRPYVDYSVGVDGVFCKVRVTQNEFYERTKHLLDRTIEMMRKLVANAKANAKADIDEIILVGGSTRMPQIAKAICAEFGKTPKLHDPDYAVANGAAIFAQKMNHYSEDIDGILKPDPFKANPISNILSKTYGLIVLGGHVSNIMFKNDTLPLDKTHIFHLAHDNQQSVLLKLYESDLEFSNENRLIDVSEVDEKCKYVAECLVEFVRGYARNTPMTICVKANNEQLFDFEVVVGTDTQKTQISLCTPDDPERRRYIESATVL